MLKSRIRFVLADVLRGLFVTVSCGSFAFIVPSEASADSIRPWGGAVMEAKGFAGSSERKEGPDQSIALKTAMLYDWLHPGNGGKYFKTPYNVDYRAQISTDASKMLAINDSFSLNANDAYQQITAVLPHPLDHTRGENPSATSASVQWNSDSVRIRNPAGQTTPDRVRLVFDLGITASDFGHDGWQGGQFGSSTVRVNETSMTISHGHDVQLIDANGSSTPFKKYYNPNDLDLKPGERLIARPGSSLAKLIAGDLSFEYKTEYDYDLPFEYKFHRPSVSGQFTVDLDVDAEGWSEAFTAEIRNQAGFAIDRDKSFGFSKSVTLGLVDVTTIDGESLGSLGYELEFASGLVLNQPTVVPEPSSIAIASVLIVAGLIARKRQNREARSAA